LIKVNQISKPESKFEFIQRKGIGNPNSLCDGIAEAILSTFQDIYIRDYGETQPCSITDLKIIGGKTEPKFGGGHVSEPSSIIILGEAAPCSQDLDDIAMDATVSYLTDLAPNFDINNIVCCFDEGSLNPKEEEKNRFKRSLIEYGVGYDTNSALGEIIYILETSFFPDQRELPDSPIGYDINLTGIRNDKDIDININCAMIDENLENKYEYESVIEQLTYELNEGMNKIFTLCNLDYTIKLKINECYKYLTTMGTFAESQNGKIRHGNSCNGLISPLYPMQFVSGLDSKYDITKIYGVLTTQLNKQLCIKYPEINEINILMHTKIDKPIINPIEINVNVNGDIDCNEIEQFIENTLPNMDVSDYPTF
jgi:S-adenosylmethionine synthetase